MTGLSEEERTLVTEMLEQKLLPETITTILQLRRTLPSQREKAAVWLNYKILHKDVLLFREIERRRHVEANSERTERRKDSAGW